MTVVYHLEQMCVSRGWFLRLHWVIALFQCVVPRIAKKHVENVDSATPVAKESHVERMVRSSLQKALSDLKISNLLCPGSVEIWIFVAIFLNCNSTPQWCVNDSCLASVYVVLRYVYDSFLIQYILKQHCLHMFVRSDHPFPGGRWQPPWDGSHLGAIAQGCERFHGSVWSAS